MSNGNFVGRREVSSTNTIQEVVVKKKNTIQLARHKSGSVLRRNYNIRKKKLTCVG